MEACMIKPEVKKKPIKPKPPPKPAQIQRNDSETLEKPAPVVPPRPTDAPKPPPKPAQIKRNDPEILEKPAPVVPPRPTNTETGSFIKSNKPDGETPAQEKGGIFSGKIFKKSLKPTEADEHPLPLNGDVSGNNGDLSESSNQEKGGFFSRLLRKSNKILGQEEELLQTQLSVSNNSLSENNNTEATESLHSELSDTTDSLSENMLLHDCELSTSSEALSESQTKERGGIFSGIFKKSPKPAETAEPDENKSADTELLIRSDLTENKQEKSGGLFSGLFKKTLKASGQSTESLDREAEKEPSASNDEQSDSNTKEQDVNSENLLSSSCENLNNRTAVKVKKRGLAGIFKKSTSTDNLFDEESNTENLSEAATPKENTGRLAGIFKKSPKPAPRSITTEDLPSNTKELLTSLDSLTNAAEEDLLMDSELLVGNNLSKASSPTKAKGRFAGMFRKTTKTVEQQKSEDMEAPEESELGHKRTIKKKKRVVSFRVKKTLPKIPNIALSSQTSDKMPVIEENVELCKLNSLQESTVEVQPVEMAAYLTENNPLESEQGNEELMEWWNTVKGWTEWNKTSNFQKEDEEVAVEQAADRVYLAARLFVHLFNQKGASLQHRILELLSLADAADQFHKKTVSAAVGGGVASVVGSVATITGLILAPFTFGASVIVTAVGISVATAGGLTSATANITDTVHSRMDRKKVEKMIQGYQEEIKDIRECLDFVQEGMDTLQEWNFEQYSQSAAKKALNHSVKHVVKEGGHAGKDLVINTSTLISTVQLLGATGGAIKAAQVISITTGVMSGLFLALDVFFLAKDSHELRKGAKTEFAAKIREVCKELQDGLLELNKVKTQLQKTMDGIEVEEYEEIEEEVVEIEDDLEWDPKKLAELEKELDLLEEKLDKKVEEEQKKSKEAEKKNLKSNEKKEKSMKDERDAEIQEKENSMREKNGKKEGKKESKKEEDEVEGKLKSKLEKLCDEDKKKTEKSVKAAKEAVKEQSQKGSKQDKETKKQKEKCESKEDKAKKDTVTNDKTAEEKKTDIKEVENRSGDLEQEDRSKKLSSERANTERENQRRDEIRGRKPEWKPVSIDKEVESGRMRRRGSERGGKHEMRESDKERGNSSRHMEKLAIKDSNGMENWRKTEEERTVKDRRSEVAKSREQTEIKEGSESEREVKRGNGKGDVRKESHQTYKTRSKREHMERERRNNTEESYSRRSQDSGEMALRDDRREGGDEKRGTRFESMRRQFEREEAKEGKRREDGESGRRDREREHTQRGHRPQSNALRGDGLYI